MYNVKEVTLDEGELFKELLQLIYGMVSPRIIWEYN